MSVEANQELFHQCCNLYIEDCHIKLVNNWSWDEKVIGVKVLKILFFFLSDHISPPNGIIEQM